MRDKFTHTRLGTIVAGLLVFKLVINMTQRAIYPFLPVIARGLGIGLPAAGAMVSVRWATGMATPLLIGTAGRRRSPINLMLVGASLFSVGSLITAATGVFVGALIGFGLLGIAKPLFDIGSQTFISQRVPFHRRARYLGLIEVSWAGGLLVGAPLFGLLINRYDWTTPFWLVGGVVGGGALVLAVVGRSRPSPPGDLQSGERTNLTGAALGLLGAVASMSFGIEMALVVLGGWLEGFGLTIVALGAVGMVLGLAELAAEGGVLAFTDRIGARWAMQIGTAGMAIGFAALALSAGSQVLGIVALAATTFAFEFGIVSAIPLATEMRPDDRPQYLAIYLVASSLGRVVADWIGPWIFAHGGLTGVAVTGAVAAAAAFAIVTRWVELPEPAARDV